MRRTIPHRISTGLPSVLALALVAAAVRAQDLADPTEQNLIAATEFAQGLVAVVGAEGADAVLTGHVSPSLALLQVVGVAGGGEVMIELGALRRDADSVDLAVFGESATRGVLAGTAIAAFPQVTADDLATERVMNLDGSAEGVSFPWDLEIIKFFTVSRFRDGSIINDRGVKIVTDGSNCIREKYIEFSRWVRSRTLNVDKIIEIKVFPGPFDPATAIRLTLDLVVTPVEGGELLLEGTIVASNNDASGDG